MRLTAGQRAAKKQKKVARGERVSSRLQHEAEVAAARAQALFEPPDAGRRMARFPIEECRVCVEMWDRGMGQVFVARSLPDGRLLVGCFLVDVYCLGVKNAFARRMSVHEYREAIRSGPETRKVAPTYAARLIFEAVRYAGNLGLSPHVDYLEAREVLAGIDASACADSFVFGHRGKPYYFCGPHDSRQFVARVFTALTRSVGVDGFRYTVPPRLLPPGFAAGDHVRDLADQCLRLVDSGDDEGFDEVDEDDLDWSHLPKGSYVIRDNGQNYLTNLSLERYEKVRHLLPRA